MPSGEYTPPTDAEMDKALAELRAAWPDAGWEFFNHSRATLITRDYGVQATPAGPVLGTATLRWTACEPGSDDDSERLAFSAVGAVALVLKRHG